MRSSHLKPTGDRLRLASVKSESKQRNIINHGLKFEEDGTEGAVRDMLYRWILYIGMDIIGLFI